MAGSFSAVSSGSYGGDTTIPVTLRRVAARMVAVVPGVAVTSMVAGSFTRRRKHVVSDGPGWSEIENRSARKGATERDLTPGAHPSPCVSLTLASALCHTRKPMTASNGPSRGDVLPAPLSSHYATQQDTIYATPILAIMQEVW